MLKQTIRLFIKALVIGALLNVGLQQIPSGDQRPARYQPLRHEQPNQVPVTAHDIN